MDNTNEQEKKYLLLMLKNIEWLIISSLIGIIVGAIIGGFLDIVYMGTNSYSNAPYYYFIIPISFFVCCYVIMKFAPEAEGRGTEKVIESLHEKDGKIDFKVVPVKFFTTLIVLISGGSAGKAGPCAQMGGGMASAFADMCRFKEIERKRCIVCGVSAALSSVFGVPIAGAVFANEVIMQRNFSYSLFILSLISSYMSYAINKCIRLNQTSYFISINNLQLVSTTIKLILFSIFISIVAIVFINLMKFTEKMINNVNIYKPYKGIVGGVFLIIIVLLTKSTDYIGLGTDIIDNTIGGIRVLKFSFIIKMLTTSITLNTAGTGGIVTPILYIGSTLGNTWGQLMNGNIAFYSGLGMVGFLASCANTPIAAIVLAVELFGFKVGGYGIIVCMTSYFLVRNFTVYPGQTEDDHSYDNYKEK